MIAGQQRISTRLPFWASTQPDKVAVIDGSRRFTYGQLSRDVAILAQNLVSYGVRKGDRVVAVLPNGYEFIALAFACIRISAIITPFNPLLQQDEIEEKIHIANPRIIIVEQDYRFEAILRKRHTIMLASEMLASQPNCLQVHDDAVLPDDDDPYVIIFTSGTTGIPKGALLSQGAIYHAVQSCVLTTSLEKTDIVLGALPFCHMFGFMFCVLMPIAYGATVACLHPFKAPAALDLIEQERITILGGVPTIYIRLAQEQERCPRDLSSLRYGQIGGAHYANLAAICKVLCCDIMPSYGLTEAPMLSAAIPGDAIELREESVGHIAPDVQIKIVDDSGVPVKNGESGEIICKTPELMMEYFNAPQDVTRHTDDDGWFHTDDLGYVDNNGYLYIHGRRSDVINRGGYKFVPSEVESLYVNNKDVLEACLISEPHPDLGMQTALFVTLKANSTLTPYDLRQYAVSKIAKYKIPDHVYILDDMPRLSTRKINKGALRALLKEKPL